MFIKVLAAILVLFLGYIIFARALPMMEFKKYYSRQGVTFSPGWSFFTDLGAFTKEVMANPNGFPFYDACHRIYGKTLPAVFGMFCGPFHTVILNAPEYLEDVYVKLNSMHTKHEFERRVFNLLIPTSIVFLESEHKDYPERRKILAAAFYKNNVARMIELIKRVTIEIVRDLQQGNV
jgi:cytochrome P450